MPLVSVVIVCMNRPDNLYPCLTSLLSQTRDVSLEVLVVAYLYDKAALSKARADFPSVKFIVNDSIAGFSENNNLALCQASGEFCFVLNDDTEMPGDTVSRLVDDLLRLEKTPGIPTPAIISPKLLNPDGSLQLLGRPAHDAWHYILQQFHLWSEASDNISGTNPVFDEVYRTCDITGAAFLIRTSLFRELGWFDQRYFFTPEDMALSALARSKGYGIYVDASVSVVHKWKTTSSRMLRATRPAAIKGSILFFGGRLWPLLGAVIWVSETLKMLKAGLVYHYKPSESNRTAYLTFKNISRSIFSRQTTKEIFTKYYTQLREEARLKG